MADGGVWTKIYPDVASLGGGKVLQVIHSKAPDQVTVNSNDFTDIGLTATITPTSDTSTILVLCEIGFTLQNDQTGEVEHNVRLLRDTTEIALTYDRAAGGMNLNGVTSYTSFSGSYSLNHQDAPSTTSPITYSVQGRRATQKTIIHYQGFANRGRSTMTLMEVAQ